MSVAVSLPRSCQVGIAAVFTTQHSLKAWARNLLNFSTKVFEAEPQTTIIKTKYRADHFHKAFHEEKLHPTETSHHIKNFLAFPNYFSFCGQRYPDLLGHGNIPEFPWTCLWGFVLTLSTCMPLSFLVLFLTAVFVSAHIHNSSLDSLAVIWKHDSALWWFG